MSALTWSVPALLLALVLVVSGVAKLRDPRSTRESFYTLRLPVQLSRSVAPVLLPWGEVALAIALLVTSGLVQLLATLAAIALFTAYLVVIVRAARFPDKVECGCLGKLGLGTVGPVTVARNVLLLVLSVVAMLDATRHESVLARVADAGAEGWRWLFGMGVTILLTGLMTHAGGSPDAGSLDGAGGVAGGGEDDGELEDYDRRPTPILWLTEVHGDRHNLRELAATQARFIVYGNLNCGSCITVLDALPAFQAANPELAVHVLVQRYDHQARTTLAPELPVFVDPELVFVQFFQLTAPGAVLFGADGALAGGPTSGVGDVLDLMADISEVLAQARAQQSPVD